MFGTYGLRFQDVYGATGGVDDAKFSGEEDPYMEADADCEGPAIGAEALDFGPAIADGFD